MLSSNSDTCKGLLCYLTAFLCFKTLWDILSISQSYRSWVYCTTSCFPLPYRFISAFLYCGSNTHRIMLILFHDFDFLLRYIYRTKISFKIIQSCILQFFYYFHRNCFHISLLCFFIFKHLTFLNVVTKHFDDLYILMN